MKTRGFCSFCECCQWDYHSDHAVISLCRGQRWRRTRRRAEDSDIALACELGIGHATGAVVDGQADVGHKFPLSDRSIGSTEPASTICPAAGGKPPVAAAHARRGALGGGTRGKCRSAAQLSTSIAERSIAQGCTRRLPNRFWSGGDAPKRSGKWWRNEERSDRRAVTALAPGRARGCARPVKLIGAGEAPADKSNPAPRRVSPCYTGLDAGLDAGWVGPDQAELVPGGTHIDIEVKEASGFVEHNRSSAIGVYGVGRGAGCIVCDDDTVAVDGDHAGAGAVAVEGIEAGQGNWRGQVVRGDRPYGTGKVVGAF